MSERALYIYALKDTNKINKKQISVHTATATLLNKISIIVVEAEAEVFF